MWRQKLWRLIKLSILKKRRKLYQHVEKDIKLLCLRDGYSKTRSLLTLWILNVLLQTLDPVAISLCWGTVSKSSFTLLKIYCQEVQG